MSTLNPNAVRRLVLVMEELRKIDAELPVQAALAFAMIMQRDGEITQRDIVNDTDMTKASVSRLITTLVNRGVIQSVRSLEDRRVWNLSLTAEGRRIAKTLVHLMEA
jgi:DNA-binding MarR family transcriptional regulator